MLVVWKAHYEASGHGQVLSERLARASFPSLGLSPCIQVQVIVPSGYQFPYNCPQIAPGGLSRQELFTISPHIEMLKDK